jgi:hypothetical protein
MTIREWFLHRDTFVPAQDGLDGYCLGEIRYGILDSQRICYTREDEDNHLENGNGKPYRRSTIPTGQYRLTLPKSGMFIFINAVPGFVQPKIRTGFALNEGDVSVGDTRFLAGVGVTVPAITRLITELRWLTMRDIEVWLNVGRAE